MRRKRMYQEISAARVKVKVRHMIIRLVFLFALTCAFVVPATAQIQPSFPMPQESLLPTEAHRPHDTTRVQQTTGPECPSITGNWHVRFSGVSCRPVFIIFLECGEVSFEQMVSFTQTGITFTGSSVPDSEGRRSQFEGTIIENTGQLSGQWRTPTYMTEECNFAFGGEASGSLEGQLSCPDMTMTLNGLWTWFDRQTCTRITDGDLNGTITAVKLGDPAIELILEPMPLNQTYIVDAIPRMPVIRAHARVRNVIPDPTATTTFTWRAGIEIDRESTTRCPNGDCTVSFENDIAQDVETEGDGVYTLTLTDENALRGGRLNISAKASVQGSMLEASTMNGLKIEGTNPPRTLIRELIDMTVQERTFSGLQHGDVGDVLKRMACHESGGQKQFDAPANGGIGPPIISFDDGIGIFQITTTESCPDPFIDCPNVLFHWKENVVEGVKAFGEKAVTAANYPARLRVDDEYRAYITTTINPQRQAAGLQPILTPPAPDFTSVGRIGSEPINQLLEDAVRGYNGYAGEGMWGFVLHEFKINEDFLLTVPDHELAQLDTDPRVWQRVLPEERDQMSGAPRYVSIITTTAPRCGE